MHEIITLQLGQRSNYVATHFWNAQESYFTYSENELPLVNHDIHFRPGVGADGSDTFTPRTLIYDLKGGFGSLRKFNALYEVQDESPLSRVPWNGATSLQKDVPIEQTQYQKNLEQGLSTFQLTSRDVRYWSDFNRVYYHPRSIIQLNEYELNSQIMPFEIWAAGEDLFQGLDKDEDILDRDLRSFAEECDQMQGFQMITGTDDAWGGFSARYIDRIRDEYGKTSVWVWGIDENLLLSQRQRIVRSLNTARSIHAMAQQASAYITLSSHPHSLPSYVRLTDGSEWCSSALLTTAIETILLPTRLRESRGQHVSLSYMELALNTNGKQNMFELAATVPQQSVDPSRIREQVVNKSNSHEKGVVEFTHSTNVGNLSENHSTFDVDYTPREFQMTEVIQPHVFAQVEMLRHSGAADPHQHGGNMSRFQQAQKVVERFETSLEFPLLDTFPQTLFTYSGPTGARACLPVHTRLATTSSTRSRLKVMGQKISRWLGVEDRDFMLNGLTEIAEGYQDGWDPGSDSDEDD